MKFLYRLLAIDGLPLRIALVVAYLVFFILAVVVIGGSDE